MRISYFHVAKDVPVGIPPETSVVIDVLRATTTIACALSNGAEAIETFSDLDQLRNRASKWPSSARLLLGERGGQPISDFDLGNSPVAVLPEVVSGKRLFMSTTNGTRALKSVREAKNLYTAALINRRAVGEKLLTENPNELWIVGSGWEGSYSLEDSLAAGALVNFLLENSSEELYVINDEVHAALALWNHWGKDTEGCLRLASHGKRLSGIGNHDFDFNCCSGIDKLSVVPTQTEKGVFCAG